MTSVAEFAPALPRVQVVHGREEFSRIADEYDAFAQRCAVPVSARAAWTKAALDAVSTTEPFGVFLRTDSGELTAGVVLLVVPGPGFDTIVPPGGLDHRAAVVAADADDAERLGDALSGVLGQWPRPTFLRLGPLPADSPVMQRFAAAIPTATIAPIESIPVVRRTASADAENYLSHNTKRALRRSYNRIVRDGVTVDLQFTRDIDEVMTLVPSMADACRDRDHAHGRISPLDDEIGRALWQRRLELLVAADMVELAVLHLDGELAAYVVGVLDGLTYRLLEGRFVTKFSRYSPGRLLEASVLQRVLDDPTLDTLDWMTSVAPETLLVANAHDDVVMVSAEVEQQSAVGARMAYR